MFPRHCSEEKLKSLEAEHTRCLSELESKGVKILQLESAIDSFQAKILQYEREVAASALKLTSAADQSKETFRLQETLQVLVIFTVLLFDSQVLVHIFHFYAIYSCDIDIVIACQCWFQKEKKFRKICIHGVRPGSGKN